MFISNCNFIYVKTTPSSYQCSFYLSITASINFFIKHLWFCLPISKHYWYHSRGHHLILHRAIKTEINHSLLLDWIITHASDMEELISSKIEDRFHRNNWKIPFMLSMLCVIFRIADVIIVFYAQNDVIFEVIWIYACLNSIFFRCLNIGNSSEPSIFIICNKAKILWCNVMQLYCMCIKGIEKLNPCHILICTTEIC